MTSPGNRTTTAGTPVALRIGISDQDGASYPPHISVSGLPPGLAMDSTGLITGWPTKPGTYTVHVSASDGLYASGSTTFTWAIPAAANTGFTGLVRQVGGTAKCLNDPGAATANGTLLNLYTCTGGKPQAWTTVQDGTIRAQGKCLTVFHNTTVELYACAAGGSAQQQWRAGTDGELVNAQYGTCLYFANANAANGSKPTMSACQNSTSQTGEHWSRTAANVVSPAPRQVHGRLGHRRGVGRGAGRLLERGRRALGDEFGRNDQARRVLPDRVGHHGRFRTDDRDVFRGGDHEVERRIRHRAPGARQPDRHRDSQR